MHKKNTNLTTRFVSSCAIIKWKTNNIYIYHTVRTVPKPNGKNVEKGANRYPNTHIQDRSVSWFGILPSMKGGGIKLSNRPKRVI